MSRGCLQFSNSFHRRWKTGFPEIETSSAGKRGANIRDIHKWRIGVGLERVTRETRMGKIAALPG